MSDISGREETLTLSRTSWQQGPLHLELEWNWYLFARTYEPRRKLLYPLWPSRLERMDHSALVLRMYQCPESEANGSDFWLLYTIRAVSITIKQIKSLWSGEPSWVYWCNKMEGWEVPTLFEINLRARYWVRTDAISSIPEAGSWSIRGSRLACDWMSSLQAS
jgi:hypothetical protein